MTMSTEKPSRRAALGALAAVPTLALPIGALAVSPANAATLDAELLGLVDAAHALEASLQVAEQARDEAQARFVRPERPKILTPSERDRALRLPMPLKEGRTRFEQSDVPNLQIMIQVIDDILPDLSSPKTIVHKLRAIEILEALEQDKCEVELAEQRCGTPGGRKASG